MENLLTFEKVDPAEAIEVSASKLTLNSVPENSVAYVYKDLGVDFLSGDIKIDVTVRRASGGGGHFYIVVANAIGTERQVFTANEEQQGASILCYGPTVIFQGHEIVASTRYYASTEYQGVLGTVYYLTIVRDEGVGTYGTLYVIIYSDAGRTDPLATLTLTLHSKINFQYIYGYQATGSSNEGSIDGYVEELTIYAQLPTVSTKAATLAEARKATLNGTLNDDGGEDCRCGFDYGLTVGYGIRTPYTLKASGQDFDYIISGLYPNSTYHFRAYAENSGGISYGDDKTFTTLTAEALGITRGFDFRGKGLRV